MENAILHKRLWPKMRGRCDTPHITYINAHKCISLYLHVFSSSLFFEMVLRMTAFCDFIKHAASLCQIFF